MRWTSEVWTEGIPKKRVVSPPCTAVDLANGAVAHTSGAKMYDVCMMQG